ncbi:hypothetical protein [Rhabdaerophilum calidifontis]|uniref:hypothetical protein n=1 Tax=Rhabdaerophilum calidifontis TaxID=2604328 RepID=UPI00123A49BD|nr:hypothetical protein [Rhabdaerophilum calidifontis]
MTSMRPEEAGHAAPPPIRRARPAGRRRLVARLWRTAERQVAEIETRLQAAETDPAHLERDAKTLAILARTVRDLVALEVEAAEAAAPAPRRSRLIADSRMPARGEAGDSTDDAGEARNLEDFRAELARRLDQLRRERPGEAPA